LPEEKCQRDGCDAPGVVRSFVDKIQNCVWRYVLCDHCDEYLLDDEKFAIARSKGSRS
jgi:hypothetical protein